MGGNFLTILLNLDTYLGVTGVEGDGKSGDIF